MKTVIIIMLGSTLHALLATIISLVVGVCGAYCLARYAFPYKQLLLSVCTIASMIPTKLVASSIVLWLHGSGSWAIIFAYCMLNIPLVIATCTGILSYRDQTVEELAWDVGATWSEAYRSVVLPTLWPSLLSLAGLIFVLCFTNVSIPLILGTHPWHYTCDMMMAELHTKGMMQECALYGALRFAIKMMVLYCCGLCSIAAIPTSTTITSVRTIALRNANWWYGYWLLIIAMVSIPWLTMVRSLVYYAHGMHIYTASVYHALLHSAQGAFLGGCVAVGLGYALLMVAMEKKNSMIIGLTMIPFLLGSIGCSITCVVGVHAGLYSPLAAATLCYGIMYYPYVFRILSMYVPLYNPCWHDVARSYGASRWDIQRYHVMPFLRTGLLRAWYVVCILGFTDVGAGTILAQEGWITIPVMMREHIQHGAYEKAWALYGLTALFVLVVWLLLAFVIKMADLFFVSVRRADVFPKERRVQL